MLEGIQGNHSVPGYIGLTLSIAIGLVAYFGNDSLQRQDKHNDEQDHKIEVLVNKIDQEKDKYADLITVTAKTANDVSWLKEQQKKQMDLLYRWDKEFYPGHNYREDGNGKPKTH